jgi:hypothetical protein
MLKQSPKWTSISNLIKIPTFWKPEKSQKIGRRKKGKDKGT